MRPGAAFASTCDAKEPVISATDTNTAPKVKSISNVIDVSQYSMLTILRMINVPTHLQHQRAVNHLHAERVVDQRLDVLRAARP